MSFSIVPVYNTPLQSSLVKFWVCVCVCMLCWKANSVMKGNDDKRMRTASCVYEPTQWIYCKVALSEKKKKIQSAFSINRSIFTDSWVYSLMIDNHLQAHPWYLQKEICRGKCWRVDTLPRYLHSHPHECSHSERFTDMLRSVWILKPTETLTCTTAFFL